MYRSTLVGNRNLYIRPYTTKIELDLLEVMTFSDYCDDNQYECIVDQILEYCVRDYDSSVSKIEKIITCLVVRDLSIGDEIRPIYTCPYCNKKIHLKYSISDIVMMSSKSSDYIKHEFISSDEFSQYSLDLDVYDDMNIDEYEFIQDNISDFLTIYNNRLDVSCSCGGDGFVNFFTFKNILTIMTDESFNSLTSWIHALVDIGGHTRSDVLDMTPVQRIMELKYFKDAHKELEDA